MRRYNYFYPYSYELYHFGIKMKSGRYKWDSGDRPYQRLEKGSNFGRKVGLFVAEKTENRLDRRFQKVEKKMTKRRRQADKQYAKAERKSVSPFSTRWGTERAFQKATKARRRVDVTMFEGSDAYQRAKKILSKIRDISMNSNLEAEGEKYLKYVLEKNEKYYQRVGIDDVMGKSIGYWQTGNNELFDLLFYNELVNQQQLYHSAKGTTWDEHKYILRKNGTYYYPDSYEGGRHLPDGEKATSGQTKDTGSDLDDKKTESDGNLSSTDLENLAWEVIRGNFGSGSERRELLGEYYQQIQDRVNEIWRETGGTWRIGGNSTPTASQKVTEEAGKKAAEAAVSKVDKKGLDMDAIYAVYDKQKKRESSSTSTNSFKSEIIKGGRNDRVK